MRRDGETVSLYELHCCNGHHHEVHVFSHFDFLHQELEDILGPKVVPVAAHTAVAQQGNMAAADIVQVEGTDMVGLDHWQVPKAGRELHTVVGVVLYPRHLVRRQQKPAQKWFETRQDERDTLG